MVKSSYLIMIRSSYSLLFHRISDTLCDLNFEKLGILFKSSLIAIIPSLMIMFKSFLIIIKSLPIMIKSFLSLLKSSLIMIPTWVAIKLALLTIIKSFLTMIKSFLIMVKPFLITIKSSICELNFTSPFLVLIICLFISVSCLKSYCFLYSLQLLPLFSLNVYYGTLLLILLNWVILEFSKLSDHLWISTKQMGIPTILLTLFFVFDSIFYFGKSLNNRGSTDTIYLSSFVGHLFNYINVFVSIGILP